MTVSFSRLSVAAAAALPALAAALTNYQGNFSVAADCADPAPLTTLGHGYTDCTPLNGTYNAIKPWEDAGGGYCHYYLFRDTACKNQITVLSDLDGECKDSAGMQSFRVSCYR